MKSKLLRRLIILIITAGTLLAILPIGASASWKQDSNGWWNTEGNSYSIGWKKIDSKWYYFDKSGYMVHNEIIDQYYIDSNGIGVATTKGEIPIKIPANWIKSKEHKLSTYVIDSKATVTYDTTETFGGSESSYINGMKYGIMKSLGEIQLSEKNYNGKNATIMQYTITTNSEIKKACSVLLFKDGKAYCFNLVSSVDYFDMAKQQLEDLLNLSLALQ